MSPVREPVESRDGSPAEDDSVARLIRLAGRREPPDPARAARVRAALHAHWSGEVRKRRRTRLIWYGSAAAAAAASLAAWLFIPPSSREPAPLSPARGPSLLVESVLGTARAMPSGSREPESGPLLRQGARVSEGEALYTGADGRLALASGGGTAVRLDVETTLRLLPGSVLALDRGTLYLDTGPLGTASGNALVIETPFGRIHHVGTQLEARVRDGALRVRVREGAARLEGMSASRFVTQGSQLDLDVAGNLSTVPVPLSGAEWSWIESVTLMPEVEGKSLRSFLDWVVREKGWRLGFADEEIERSAERILLSGSIEGLTIDQGLDAVLPTCGMIRDLEEDLLVIRAAPVARGEE